MVKARNLSNQRIKRKSTNPANAVINESAPERVKRRNVRTFPLNFDIRRKERVNIRISIRNLVIPLKRRNTEPNWLNRIKSRKQIKIEHMQLWV